MIVGYARVSTTDQDLTIQMDALAAAGCERVFEEKRSGTTTAGREKLADCLDFVREGDILLVTRLDRIARSQHDLHAIVRKLSDKGVGFRCTEQGGVDTTTSTGKLLLGILATVAEFETDLRRERQMEGIAKAKTAGIYKGRKKTIDDAEVRRLSLEGNGPAAIAKELGINRASVYRALSHDT